jgi:para-aminobenzoate synthetase/4-amino-4-deoxychorismate lyase
LNVIAELESAPRDVYTGAIGFASPVAGLELSVVIRTFEFDGERAWLGVGGGIVADSDPSAEAAECLTKALPLLEAIGARVGDRADPAAVTAAPPPSRLGPKPVPRPDPAAGVFETLLVAGGRAVALDRHLTRLARSVRELYRRALPVGLAEELSERALGVQRARMRVSARPAGSRIRAAVELTPAPDRRSPVRLHPVTVPGGLGPHKWIDRRLLDALRDGVGGEPLLCDLDGLVLEAGRASVFAVDRHGRLLTPPADGRILPGVTRRRVLELAGRLGIETVVRPLPLGELAGAQELFVTGALGGVEPAHLAGALREQGSVTAALRSHLARPPAAVTPL